jgi:predicted CXXCH cytochrome family protein
MRENVPGLSCSDSRAKFPALLLIVTLGSALGLVGLVATRASAADESAAKSSSPPTMVQAADAEPLKESPAADQQGQSAAQTKAAQTKSAQDKAAQNDQTDATQQAASRMASGLIGGAHDFTGQGRVGRDLCMPCHTPHLVNAPAPRLDQRTDSPPPLRPWEQGQVELDGWSLMCLSCHDGITAPDVFTSAHAVTQLPRSVRRRGDVSKLPGHPVGTIYPQQADRYHTRAAVEQSGLPLPEGRIQCVTCHDPHNTGRHAGLLQISNDRSRLCLSCHNL